jgi:hypothetical protein
VCPLLVELGPWVLMQAHLDIPFLSNAVLCGLAGFWQVMSTAPAPHGERHSSIRRTAKLRSLQLSPQSRVMYESQACCRQYKKATAKLARCLPSDSTMTCSTFEACTPPSAVQQLYLCRRGYHRDITVKTVYTVTRAKRVCTMLPEDECGCTGSCSACMAKPSGTALIVPAGASIQTLMLSEHFARLHHVTLPSITHPAVTHAAMEGSSHAACLLLRNHSRH